MNCSIKERVAVVMLVTVLGRGPAPKPWFQTFQVSNNRGQRQAHGCSISLVEEPVMKLEVG